MSEAVTRAIIRDGSPRRRARVAGWLSLLTLLAGVFAQGFVSDRLVVWTDAAATAKNILGHPRLYQLGFTVYLVEMACQIIVTALFYGLLKPVNRSLSFVVACVGLAGCIIKTMGRIFYAAPLFILDGTHVYGALAEERLPALSLISLEVNDHAAAMAMAFFGIAALLKGYLILRSTFLPRILGALSMAAGAGLLAYLHPPLGYRLFPLLAALGLVAWLPQVGWLITVGLNEERWYEQAGATGPGTVARATGDE
jgi:Domain of unknown function (DUF4386)